MLTVRNDCGTARKASSEVLMITGRVMIESVSEADRMEVPNLRNRTNSPSPNKPYTTDGIPDRLMMAIRIARVRGVSDAYSDKYTAAAIPSGTEKIAVPMVR